jgi:hypothetical protein
VIVALNFISERTALAGMQLLYGTECSFFFPATDEEGLDDRPLGGHGILYEASLQGAAGLYGTTTSSPLLSHTFFNAK